MSPSEITSIHDMLNDPALVRRGELLAMPIDLAELEAAGVLRRRGRWWQVLDFHRLPEHAWAKVRALRDNRKKGESLVQFERIRPQVVAIMGGLTKCPCKLSLMRRPRPSKGS